METPLITTIIPTFKRPHLLKRALSSFGKIGVIRLSICMPTYNFGKFIGETLESIVPQLTNEIEIVIVDGASTDSTSEIVGHYQEKYPQIQYHRLSQRGGVDRDLATSISLARGEYCWLFSSDDIMGKTSIAKIFQELHSEFDVYLCGFDVCNFNMDFIRKEKFFSFKKNALFNLSNKAERLDYFRKAVSLVAFFAFMSSIIFKKIRWDETPAEEVFMGSCWAHAARILRMIPKGLLVQYLHDSYLQQRCDNGSLIFKGHVDRAAIFIEGYQKIGDVIFGNASEETALIRRAMQNDISLKYVLKAKASSTTSQEAKRLVFLVKKLYRNRKVLRFFASVAIALFFPLLGKAVLLFYEKKRKIKRFMNALIKNP